MNNWHDLHKKYMFDLLNKIYNSKYGKSLGFKGGTALYFFYELDRFSVDLDFNLTENINDIVSFRDEFLKFLKENYSQKNISIKIEGKLKNSFRFIFQYGGERKIKIEVSSKIYDDKYEIKNLFGLNVNVMKVDYMFAYKICAFFSRQQNTGKIANRDIFDIYFLLNNGYHPNEYIIKQRTKKIFGKELDVKGIYQELIDYLEKNSKTINKDILNELGDMLDDKTKNFVKNKLLDDLLNKLRFNVYFL